MKKILNAILFILSFIWQLPQSIIGLFMLVYFKIFGGAKLISYKKLCFCFNAEKMSGGISLGNFAFVSPLSAKKAPVVAHEQEGHTVQSKILGPLYLIVIGLPSLLNASFDFTKCYFDFYTEKNANFFAKLDVDERCRLKFKDYLD